MCMCVCAYPRVEFPSRLTRSPFLLSKRRHCRVERSTKEPASRVLRTHTHTHTGLLCIYVTLLIQWRHVDRHLYCFWSMDCPFKFSDVWRELIYDLIIKQLKLVPVDCEISITNDKCTNLTSYKIFHTYI